jgi:hypothetical protein
MMEAIPSRDINSLSYISHMQCEQQKNICMQTIIMHIIIIINNNNNIVEIVRDIKSLTSILRFYFLSSPPQTNVEVAEKFERVNVSNACSDESKSNCWLS